MQNFAILRFGKGSTQHSNGREMEIGKNFSLSFASKTHKIAYFLVFNNERFHYLVIGQLSVRF